MIECKELVKLHKHKCVICKKTYALSSIKRCINYCYKCYLDKLKGDKR